MYINDIHILYYFFIGLLGMCVGQFLDFANNKLQNHEHVICKEFFNEYIPNIKNKKPLTKNLSRNRIFLLFTSVFKLIFPL